VSPRRAGRPALPPAAWRWLLAAAVVVQLVALYWPRPVDTGGPPGLDKVVHCAVFAAVAFTGRRAGVPVAWLAGLLVAHAAVSEVVQATLLPRDGDVLDAVADTVGTVAGLLLAGAPVRREAARAAR
jgi:VanZ family protein